MAKSVYIHIPFCRSICSYCDFCKMYYDEKVADKYLDALFLECKDNYNGEKLNTLYIGGGTPSTLSNTNFEKLFKIVKLFKFEKNYEFTIEANINDITEEKLKIFKSLGVNRLSIGVETVNDKFLKLLGRAHTKEEVIDKINLAKKYFSNLNIDLMYAFPSETISDLICDINFVLNLNPTHISIYSLIIEEHTKLFIDGITSISQELDRVMYETIIENLKKSGYIHYEISNFAKDGFQSKHNLVYWDNDEYYGFGIGASGYISNVRYSNTRSINKYLNNEYRRDEETIIKELAMEYEMILGLRKIEGVSKEKFYQKYSLAISDVFDIIDLVDKKLLVDGKENIYINEYNLYVSNSILVNFVGGSIYGESREN